MTPKPVQRTYRILVVDDHDICIRHVMAALETPSSETRAAFTADEAIGLAVDWLPDVICIDMHLQDRAGAEVIREIRQAWPEGRPEPKIIVLSGQQAVISAQDMEQLDVDFSLVKPVSGGQLRQLTGVAEPAVGQTPNSDDQQRQLYDLFLTELDQRIPQLDRCFSGLELDKMADILHQLIASAAIVREFRFETELRSLNASCRNGGPNRELAFRYHSVLESARRLLTQR